MGILEGLRYHLRGLSLVVKVPRLLFWGLLRFLVVFVLALACASAVFYYHAEILSAVWTRPDSVWFVWLWYAVSWLVSLCLAALAAILSYLISQIIFSVIIMDLMSRITERRVTGRVIETRSLATARLFLYLVKQEIPRTVIPVILSLLLLVLGWLTPLGPLVAVFTSALAAAFLAWDHTDLTPARRLLPFKKRFALFAKRLDFHIGFGLPFLIPGLNLVLLSFAPVGGTLYYLDTQSSDTPPPKTPDPMPCSGAPQPQG